MKIDEAIKHAEEVAEQNEWFEKNCLESMQCKECAEEHRQLAEWLKDYKRLLEQESYKVCDQVTWERNILIDEIRAEIEAYQSDAFYPDNVMMNKRMVLEIIDKYRSESDCRKCKVEHDCYECKKYAESEES